MNRLHLSALTAALLLAPCALAGETVTRLIVGDAKTNTLTVLDTGSGRPLASFGTPGRISGLSTGPGGTYAYGMHGDDDRVTVLHSGLGVVDHGDHGDLIQKAPHVLATLNVGQKPTHFFAHGERIAIFNDKGGDIAVFGEALLGKTNDMQVVKVAQPDHGAPALIGDVLLSGHLHLNRVDAYDLKTGRLLRTLEQPCPGLHGEAVLGQVAYFGCADGVLAVTVQGQNVAARKLGHPANTPQGTRVGTVVSHEKSPVLYGNFGKGLARWAAGDTALTPVSLPATPLKFAFAPGGQRLLVLTAEGRLHALDARTGRVLNSAALLPAVDLNDKAVIRPTMTLGPAHAYVTSPATGEVLEVALGDLSVARRLAVGGTPTLLAVTSATGETH